MPERSSRSGTATVVGGGPAGLIAAEVLADAGMSVPGDVGIIGFNDMEMAGWANIGLTTVHQPVAKIIEASVDLVVALVDAPQTAPAVRLFPCHIVSRKTLKDRV